MISKVNGCCLYYLIYFWSQPWYALLFRMSLGTPAFLLSWPQCGALQSRECLPSSCGEGFDLNYLVSGWLYYVFFREGNQPMSFLNAYLFSLVLFRVSLTLACPMNLKLYPLDRQQCSLRVASCKYRTHTLFVCYSRVMCVIKSNTTTVEAMTSFRSVPNLVARPNPKTITWTLVPVPEEITGEEIHNTTLDFNTLPKTTGIPLTLVHVVHIHVMEPTRSYWKRESWM